MISKVTSRGQTTIPREVRKALGLKASDKILYILEGKQAIIKRGAVEFGSLDNRLQNIKSERLLPCFRHY